MTTPRASPRCSPRSSPRASSVSFPLKWIDGEQGEFFSEWRARFSAFCTMGLVLCAQLAILTLLSLCAFLLYTYINQVPIAPTPESCANICAASASAASALLPAKTADVSPRREVTAVSAVPTYVAPTLKVCELEIVGGRLTDHYGSWPLCSNHVPENAIVYSFGIGKDVSFDMEMIRRGATVFAFDPTVTPDEAAAMFKAAGNEHLLDRFVYTQVGLGATNAVVTFFKPRNKALQSMTALETADSSRFVKEGFPAAVLTLQTIMALKGHDHVDLLKVDVEGVEFDICDMPDFQASLDRVGHVVYEFHERFLPETGEARKAKCTQILADHGFRKVMATADGENVFARIPSNGLVVKAKLRRQQKLGAVGGRRTRFPKHKKELIDPISGRSFS